MVNLCQICEKVINEGEAVELVVEGIYRLIPSIKSFAMYKNLKFRPGTLAHVECPEENE